MKNTKPFYLSSILALALASCGGTQKMVTVDAAKVDQMPLKTSKITEKQLQRFYIK